MQRFFFILLSLLLFFCQNLQGQNNNKRSIIDAEDAIVGASRIELYISDLQDKNVGVIANQTSIFNGIHLIDTLLSHGIRIKKIFTPEHGFRGSADEGAIINNSIDEKTQLPIISLYGKNKKPDSSQLEDIDILIFDLQDVGTRFYTYISTMTYVMEAAAENNIPMIVLDRPNPNGFYIDGPIMEKENISFVGLHPVPIVYALTIGEYALMVNGEFWLSDSLQCELKVIPLGNYDRNSIYKLSVKPSPNLPNWESVYLYPSLCLFEGTIVSVGRGTEKPFQVYGHPLISDEFAFIPRKKEGHRAPLYCDQECRGEFLIDYANNYQENPDRINLSWLIKAYNGLSNQTDFFNNFFIKLSGSETLRKQIENGLSEEEIRNTWSKNIKDYKNIRAKYLIYKDFK
ncbi:MAG: DUF1343 domain-containing protein [Lentimicrobiaceae bacterium]|nr:DUF1343 domain-containing protein [Lentimicrobiaceae bacterium]